MKTYASAVSSSKHKAVMVDRLVLMLALISSSFGDKHSIRTRRTERVRSFSAYAYAYAYAYVVGVLTCFSADSAFALCVRLCASENQTLIFLLRQK